jgi:hypothetical protein
MFCPPASMPPGAASGEACSLISAIDGIKMISLRSIAQAARRVPLLARYDERARRDVRSAAGFVSLTA